MVPQNRIKKHLENFLKEEGAILLMDNCILSDGATWLQDQLKIRITQSDKNKIVIRMENNSRNGFTEYSKEVEL